MSALGQGRPSALAIIDAINAATPQQRLNLSDALRYLLYPSVQEPGVVWRDYIVQYRTTPGSPYDPSQPPNAATPVLMPSPSFIYGEWEAASVGGDYKNSPVTSDTYNPDLNDAIWSFDNLRPGEYRLSYNWVADPSLATNSPFAIMDDRATLRTIRLNQRKPPVGFNDGAISYQDFINPLVVTENRGIYVRLSRYQTTVDGRMQAGKMRLELLKDLSDGTGSVPDVKVPTTEWYVKGVKANWGGDITPQVILSNLRNGSSFDELVANYNITWEAVLACFGWEIETGGK